VKSKDAMSDCTPTGSITQNASKVDETIAAFKELKDNINKNSTRPGEKLL
jgi:hypothetical protein